MLGIIFDFFAYLLNHLLSNLSWGGGKEVSTWGARLFYTFLFLFLFALFIGCVMLARR